MTTMYRSVAPVRLQTILLEKAWREPSPSFPCAGLIFAAVNHFDVGGKGIVDLPRAMAVL
jgi:hypothetical protein